tara:strand:- start:153513 stop:154259 length:747 start_codon:yes stop_codon:yes gene_type:complete
MLKKKDSWFTVDTAIAPAYERPSFKSQKITEILNGESVKVSKKKGGWIFITQTDGYKSWVKEFYGNYSDIPFDASHVITEKGELPFGSLVKKDDNKIVCANGDHKLISQSINRLNNLQKPKKLLEMARTLIGCPYRWGGRSSLGFDCSGFVQMLFLGSGVVFPRDSYQQHALLLDKQIEGSLSMPGDIHFFGRKNEITHVGLSTGGWGIIHCQGFVKEESIFPIAEEKKNKLADIYLSTHSTELNFDI